MTDDLQAEIIQLAWRCPVCGVDNNIDDVGGYPGICWDCGLAAVVSRKSKVDGFAGPPARTQIPLEYASGVAIILNADIGRLQVNNWARELSAAATMAHAQQRRREIRRRIEGPRLVGPEGDLD